MLQLMLLSTLNVIIGGLALNVIELDGPDWTASAFLVTPRAKNCSFAPNSDFKPHGGGSSGYNSGKVADAQACCARFTVHIIKDLEFTLFSLYANKTDHIVSI